MAAEAAHTRNTERRTLGRRDALKVGGLSLSLAAVAAACGEDRGGDTAPGRVGNAPVITEPPSYAVDDAVLLRTASSLEHTAINAYRQMLALGALDDSVESLITEFVDNHQAVADELAGLTTDVGGEAWNCVNPWYMERTIAPLMAAVVSSDNQTIDMFNIAVALENLAASTHQAFSIRLDDAPARVATLSAAKLESRQSSALVINVRGVEGYVSPAINNEEVPRDAVGLPQQFALTHRFGSIGQVDIIAGPPDENGVRETFTIQIPAENSYIYNELDPVC